MNRIDGSTQSTAAAHTSPFLKPLAIFDQLQPQQLVAGCRNVQADGSHEAFCFELFRRAIVEKRQQCWAVLYEQYLKLAYSWTVTFAKTNSHIGSSSIDDLVQDTFTSFWRSYTPEHLAKASSLGSVLAYMKSCAWSSVQHAVRKVNAQLDEHDQDVSELNIPSERSMAPDQAVLATLEVEQLWRVITRCCRDTREQKIARLRFVEGLKPREIIECCPDLAQTESDIYKVVRNIRARVARNLSAQGIEGDETS